MVNEPQMTIYEVSRRTGVGVSTLWSWARRGVLPRPVSGLGDAGRGRVARWPVNIVPRIHDIRRRQRAGVLLEEIARENTTTAA